MNEKLDFSLPKKKQKNTIINFFIIILLLILVILTAASLVLKPSGQTKTPNATDSSLSSEQTKQLAGKLAQRNLNIRAAKVWQGYLTESKVTDEERARTLFQIGTLFEKAALYDQAIEYFYRSEITAEIDELKPQISTHIKDCFEKLGNFSALRYELMDRTSLDSAPAAGSKIIAEIGAEKITEADLDSIIENDINSQLEPMAMFMTAEQLNEQKKKMLEQYKTTEAKQRYLQNWLAQEVLYRQALQEKLTEEPETKKHIDQLMRSALSQIIMNRELASKINITETDIQTYYMANKDKFVEPAKAQISHILVDDEQQAKELIEKINNGEDFGELAKQFSQDEETKQNGGRIAAEVSKGSDVPGIGTENELNEKIFAVDAPKVLDKPFKTEKGWEIIKVETKTDERQKSLDEVKQQVVMMLANQKSQDVQRDCIEQLMDKYNVIIHTSALSGSNKPDEENKQQ
jgi:peptidyl-prolyl cis-trans isomerase C